MHDAGSSSAPTPGSTASAASSPAGRNAPTPTSRCRRVSVPQSIGESSPAGGGHVCADRAEHLTDEAVRGPAGERDRPAGAADAQECPAACRSRPPSRRRSSRRGAGDQRGCRLVRPARAADPKRPEGRPTRRRRGCNPARVRGARAVAARKRTEPGLSHGSVHRRWTSSHLRCTPFGPRGPCADGGMASTIESPNQACAEIEGEESS